MIPEKIYEKSDAGQIPSKQSELSQLALMERPFQTLFKGRTYIRGPQQDNTPNLVH